AASDGRRCRREVQGTHRRGPAVAQRPGGRRRPAADPRRPARRPHRPRTRWPRTFDRDGEALRDVRRPQGSFIAMAPPAIETKGLHKTYKVGFFRNKQVRALQGLDLTVEQGQVYGLIGPNGAGKSTTIKILMDLVQASSGAARLFGIDVRERDARRLVGFVPENPAPYEYLTGRELVTLSGNLCGLSGKDLSERTQRVIDLVEMTRAADLQIRRYSKGMVQRVALAQALVSKPKLLILDEPTSGLDPVGRRQMRVLIEKQRAEGTTVLFCSHIIPDVEALCDRVAILVGGKRVLEGTLPELLRSQDPRVELTVQGLTADRLSALKLPTPISDASETELRVEVPEGDRERALSALLGASARVTALKVVRPTLEQLFMGAVDQARKQGGSVGGVMDL